MHRGYFSLHGFQVNRGTGGDPGGKTYRAQRQQLECQFALDCHKIAGIQNLYKIQIVENFGGDGCIQADRATVKKI